VSVGTDLDKLDIFTIRSIDLAFAYGKSVGRMSSKAGWAAPYHSEMNMS
jgi:hypothetical protein